MRPRWSLVTLLLGCARGPLSGVDDGREVRVQASPAALSASDESALRAAIAGRGPLYWRVRDGAGPRCEAWQLEPDADDPANTTLPGVVATLRPTSNAVSSVIDTRPRAKSCTNRRMPSTRLAPPLSSAVCSASGGTSWSAFTILIAARRIAVSSCTVGNSTRT